MNSNYHEYFKENDKRNKVFTDPYVPGTGEGSLIERFPFRVSANTIPIYLPKSLESSPFAQHESLDHYCHDLDIPLDTGIQEMNACRFAEDFEFWAGLTTMIEPKTDIGGTLPVVPFILRYAQRILLAELEKMRIAEMPIRIILVKARQWGGSTLIEIYMAWIQLIHKINWHSVIVGDTEEQSITVRSMYNTLLDNYELKDYVLESFEGSTKTRIIKDRRCVISVGSMVKPEGLRVKNIKMAHCTEIASWQSSETRKPEDLMQTITGSILEEPYSFLALESTAKGSGGFFHREYMAATQKKNPYTPLFIPWFLIELYQIEFEDVEEAKALIDSMTEYEKSVWGMGATLEGIKWYRVKLKNYHNDTWRMFSEFPSSAEEAFASSGRLFFPPQYSMKIKKTMRVPPFIGEIYPEGTGKEILENIFPLKQEHGNLRIWDMPNKPAPPEDFIYQNRYIVTVDIGGKSKTADWSTINGFDRAPMTKGGVPQRVFSWKGRIDQDIMAWKAAQLAHIYGDALLAIEANFTGQNQGDTEGQHFETFIDEIGKVVKNMYTRTPVDQVRAGLPTKYDWWTTNDNKTRISNFMLKLLREDGLLEFDEEVYYEASFYEHKDPSRGGRNRMGHVEGQHDDVLIPTMIGYWLCYNERPCVLVEKRKEGIVSVSNGSYADY